MAAAILKASKKIPLGSRILFVADAYDAMTSDRVYRGKLSHEDAVAELERCAGAQFDPTVVQVFLEGLEQGARDLKQARDYQLPAAAAEGREQSAAATTRGPTTTQRHADFLSTSSMPPTRIGSPSRCAHPQKGPVGHLRR